MEDTSDCEMDAVLPDSRDLLYMLSPYNRETCVCHIPDTSLTDLEHGGQGSET